MVGWLHRLNALESEQAPGDGKGQESLACCSPSGRKESDGTEQHTEEPGRAQPSLRVKTTGVSTVWAGGGAVESRNWLESWEPRQGKKISIFSNPPDHVLRYIYIYIYIYFFFFLTSHSLVRASLMVQWLKTVFPMLGTQIWSLVKDLVCSSCN